ncbi:hypothetical protein [Oceanobacter antarcticus]|uniref:Uncharacterized protein n=1 Tax=Oceanobacter antarcticus TaxID=3133425 RepID=A0ABW8NDY7_9GAMM
MQPQQKPTALERAISGFSATVAILGAVLLLPVLAQYIRPFAFDFLRPDLGTELAQFGSWAVILLISVSVFFGASALLQVLIMMLFRRGHHHNRGPF